MLCCTYTELKSKIKETTQNKRNIETTNAYIAKNGKLNQFCSLRFRNSIELTLQRHHGNRGAGPRSIPPPHQERGGRAVDSRVPVSSSAAAPSAGARDPRRQPRPSSSSRGPTHHGYGEGRGTQYYPPKGVFYKPVRSWSFSEKKIIFLCCRFASYTHRHAHTQRKMFVFLFEFFFSFL